MSSARGDLGRALCVVTGASRGFGRAVAKDLARLVLPGSVLVLVARSGDDLRAVQAEAAAAGGGGLLVKCVAADLAQMDGVERAVKASEEAASPEVEHVVLVNNAGEARTAGFRPFQLLGCSIFRRESRSSKVDGRAVLTRN